MYGKLKSEVSSALSIHNSQFSVTWMVVVALAVLSPLLAGIFNNEIGFSIFGSLVGYMLGLCSESGPLKHRLKVVTLGFVFYVFAFGLGLSLEHSIAVFFIISFVLVYTLGVIAGKGADVERILVLGGVLLYVARYTPLHFETDFKRIIIYILISYVTVIATNILLSTVRHFSRENHVQIRHSMSQILTLDRVRHYYALTYASAVLISIALVEMVTIERGYWMVITVLLMMRPTKRESFHRVIQRIVGTLMGVLLGLPFVYIHFSVIVYALLATVFAALVTFVWKRNYWLVSLCATVFVICLLEVATHGTLNAMVTLARIRATVIGCALSAAVIFVFHVLEPVLLKNKHASKSES